MSGITSGFLKNDEAIGAARKRIERSMDRALRSGKVDETARDEAFSRIQLSTDYGLLEDRQLIVESVIENDLTPLQRRIFHLKHLRRQSIRNIALALGKSEDAIKANLYRMRRAISQSTPGLESLLDARY